MLSPVVYSVSQVAAYLKDKLESDSLLSRLTVQGEIANLRTAGSGHSYFSLRGDRGSTLRCVMFRGRSGQEYLAEGQEVLAGGSFTFYAPGGEANLQVSAVAPVGAGALALELARLRQQLEAEGLFDAARKRPLPLFPRVIGVVTSPTGAVWQDIQNVTRRRYPLAELRLSPAAVQGEGAAGQIARAIGRLNAEKRAEVIIVARGGGSLEDLWCFNAEEVARAIFASGIPVISGVGHETDRTIADDVADRRAPTPSAAAEVATPDRQQLLANVLAGRQQLSALLLGQIDRRRSLTTAQRQRLERCVPDIGRLRRQVDDLAERSAAAARRRNDAMRLAVGTLEAQLVALNPAATLRRGYAVVRRAGDGTVLTAPGQAADGELLGITLSGGTMDAIAGRYAGGSGGNGNAPAPNQAGAGAAAAGVASIESQNGPLRPARGVAPRRRRRRPEPPTAMRPLL